MVDQKKNSIKKKEKYNKTGPQNKKTRKNSVTNFFTSKPVLKNYLTQPRLGLEHVQKSSNDTEKCVK